MMKNEIFLLLLFSCYGYLSFCFKIPSHPFLNPSFRAKNLKLTRSNRLSLRAKLIVGLNKYSHDASCCILDGDTGKVLFAQAKERLTRKKHDGGSTGDILRYGLNQIDATLSDIHTVVSNNHHFRVNPFEKRLNFTVPMKYYPQDYLDAYNLIPQARHLELSHHLAHAWSSISTAPFTSGVALVMDGMGESYQAMIEDLYVNNDQSDDYMHDLKLLKNQPGSCNFFPSNLFAGSTYREAETAYYFDVTKGEIRPIFKRWSKERAPAQSYNQGFEEMESLGSIYSRISSQIYGDWNACGKVMGLASWATHYKYTKQAKYCYFDASPNNKQTFQSVDTHFANHHFPPFFQGNPFDGTFQINWDTLYNLQHPNEYSDEKFSYYAKMASVIQENLNEVSMKVVDSLKPFSDNLIISGGVALNSVMNEKIRTSKAFSQVYVPPAPGDEGIAIGCAYYGYHRMKKEIEEEDKSRSIFQLPSHAYTGTLLSNIELFNILDEFEPWVDKVYFDNTTEMIQDAANQISNGKIVGWCQGRAEFGQRALGSRSLLADPRNPYLRNIINEYIKEREWYRPLAPSVLADKVNEWFTTSEITNSSHLSNNYSPYMSFTSRIKDSKASSVPTIAHIDQTARLQTVDKIDNELYYLLIQEFYKLTKIPMVLNTSLNRKKEPIVESPRDALRFLMSCNGFVSFLYIGNYRINLKSFPLHLPARNVNAMTDTKVLISVKPSKKERRYYIKPNTVYLNEINFPPIPLLDQVPIEIENQKKYRIMASSPSSEEPTWISLPSELHHDIMQVLVDQSLDRKELDSLTTVELWEILQELYLDGESCECSPEEENSGVPCKIHTKYNWADVKHALAWLNKMTLISLHSIDENQNDIHDNSKHSLVDQQGSDEMTVTSHSIDGFNPDNTDNFNDNDNDNNSENENEITVREYSQPNEIYLKSSLENNISDETTPI